MAHPSLQSLWHRTRAALQREQGQGLVEYGLIVALVAIGLVAALVALKGNLASVFSTVGNPLSSSSSGS